VDEYQAAARRIVEVLGEPATRDFLTLLESNDTVRADTFRRLYERGDKDALLDSLHDIEADPFMRGWLVEHPAPGVGWRLAAEIWISDATVAGCRRASRA
jgi:hypothetical protein